MAESWDASVAGGKPVWPMGSQCGQWEASVVGGVADGIRVAEKWDARWCGRELWPGGVPVWPRIGMSVWPRTGMSVRPRIGMPVWPRIGMPLGMLRIGICSGASEATGESGITRMSTSLRHHLPYLA